MKFWFNCVVFISFFYMILAEIEVSQTESPTETDKTVKHTFARLLKSIVNVNEHRVDVLKKLSKLQEFDVAKSNLRSADERDSSDFTSGNFEDDDRKILAIIIVDQGQFLRTDDNKISQSKDERESLETSETTSQSTETSDVDEDKDTNDVEHLLQTNNLRVMNIDKEQMEMLRKSWRSSCDKKAARVCKKACRNTYKNVCTTYRCSSRMKKAFKSECKSSCEGKFRSDSKYYSDIE